MINKTLAAEKYPIGGWFEGLGPLGDVSSFAPNIDESAGLLAKTISNIIGFMTIIAGIWFIFQFISGAYGYLSASGDQQKMTSATKKITSALIGLIVIVAAYAVISLLGELLGFNFLNIKQLIQNLGPK